MRYRKDSEIEYEITYNVSNNIKALMNLKKVSFLDLSNRLNVSYSTLTRMINGQQRISLSLLLKICDAFNLSLEKLTELNDIQLKECN